jgi:hypothetical protein
MTTPASDATFFSYSRTDSVFVLKLAKDLREAGVQIWLDKLDIKPGSHWDSSIEAALNACQRMILVLSPSSVESTNVMDEVSFALENNKTIIPVLLSECKLPFRLKRLQWIDFTGDYNTGLQQLLDSLGNPTFNTNKESNPASTKKTEETSGTESYPENAADKNHEPVKKSNSKKYLLFTAGIVFIGLAVWAFLQFGKGNSDDSKSKKENDLPVNNNPIINQDSLNKVKQDSIIAAKKATKDSIGIGKPFRGGIIFYIDPTGESGLIAATEDESTSVKWGDGRINTGASGTDMGTGKSNTEKILSWEGGENAAQICSSRNKDGYNDWFLPSREELNKLFSSSTLPLLRGFSNSDYWSSTEFSTGNATVQNFGNGNIIKDRNKKTRCHVRAIRRF